MSTAGFLPRMILSLMKSHVSSIDSGLSTSTTGPTVASSNGSRVGIRRFYSWPINMSHHRLVAVKHANEHATICGVILIKLRIACRAVPPKHAVMVGRARFYNTSYCMVGRARCIHLDIMILLAHEQPRGFKRGFPPVRGPTP